MGYLVTNRGADVHAWARIGNETSIEWTAGGGEVELILGGRHGFELLASTEGLRALLREGAKALQKLDAEEPA